MKFNYCASINHLLASKPKKKRETIISVLVAEMLSKADRQLTMPRHRAYI
jgi:phosphoribosylpyrophosphate synthetase